MIIVMSSFSIPISKCCPSHENEKLAFSNSSGLRGVFVKLRLRDGLVWTVVPNVEIWLRFQIPPV